MDQLFLSSAKGSRKKRGGVVFGWFLACALCFVAGCEKAPVKPVDIKSTDTCFYCKAPIADVTFAAEFVTSNGFVRKFDDFSCLVANAKRVGKKNVVAYYAIDSQTKKMFPIEDVQLVRSNRLRTPQGSGVVAFKDAATADQFTSQYQAEKIKLDDLLP